MNENSIFFAVDKIEDKFIEEAAESAMEENSVQPIFITPTQKKTKKPIFAILGIAACFVLIFGVGIAVSRNSGIEITQTLPPINTAEPQTQTQTTSAEITTSNEIIRPSLENNTVTSAPTVAANDNTIIAVDFIRDFYATLSTHDESILDLDKYFNDGDLKDRMAECKNKLLKNNDFYEKEHFAIGYAAAISNKEIDGDIHLITVAYIYSYLTKPYDYENPQNNDWKEREKYAPFAVKDGKILNFAVENYFEALSPDENVPEVQIVQSHITNVFSDSGTRVFDLDGIGYECDTNVKTYDCISEEGGFLKIITPEGNIELRDYQGDSDEIIDTLKKIYLFDGGSASCLGNTGRVSANGISFTDALLYRTVNNKLLMLGKAPENCPTGCDPENYRVAVLLQPEPTPPESTPPNNWHNEGYIIPENWLPIMKNDEAFENLDSLFNEPQAGKSISEIIQNLVNRNIVAIDIFYGWGPSFTEEYKVEEPNFGVVNPHTGKTNLYAIKSDYFSSLEEIEDIMNKTYTADLAHERLYGQDGDRQIFIERDNKLFVDYNCMYIWSALPFEDDSYIEIITDDEEECFFNYHFILRDPFDYENNYTEELYPHHYIVTLRAAKENGEWRLCSFVFNNPNNDYARDSLDFISIIDKIIRNAKTVEEITTKIKNLGKGHGHVINAVNVYKNSTDLDPIENGAIEYGMCVRVDYDGEYWLEQAII